MIDDGSPDNCGYLIEEWTKKDNHIIALHPKNGGLAAARNAGLNSCHGVFVGSDDYIAKNYIKMLQTAMRNQTNLVISHYYEVDAISGEQFDIKHNPTKIYILMDFGSSTINQKEMLFPWW